MVNQTQPPSSSSVDHTQQQFWSSTPNQPMTTNVADTNVDDISERTVADEANQTGTNDETGNVDNDGTSHRSFFSDFGSFFGKGKHLLAKEDEYVEDEYEEEKKIKLPPKKLLGKLGGKKDESKKLLAIPVQETEYETVAQPVVEVKPVKKLKIKKPKIQPVAVAADEYAAAPVQPVASGYGYGVQPQAQPLLNSGYAPAPPMPYPGHYRIDSQPKGKFSKFFFAETIYQKDFNQSFSTTFSTKFNRKH